MKKIIYFLSVGLFATVCVMNSSAKPMAFYGGFINVTTSGNYFTGFSTTINCGRNPFVCFTLDRDAGTVTLGNLTTAHTGGKPGAVAGINVAPVIVTPVQTSNGTTYHMENVRSVQ